MREYLLQNVDLTKLTAWCIDPKGQGNLTFLNGYEILAIDMVGQLLIIKDNSGGVDEYARSRFVIRPKD